jgi:hypothetical protein
MKFCNEGSLDVPSKCPSSGRLINNGLYLELEEEKTYFHYVVTNSYDFRA